MGTSLTGTEIKDTYDSLLKISDNGPISGTLKTLTDGLGNDSALALSTSAIKVTGGISGTNGFNGFAGATHNLLIDWSASSQFTTLTATDVFFGTNANERMRITSAGNVGIGTSSPAAKLHAYGGDIFLGLDWASANYDITPRQFRIASNGDNSGYITQAAYNSSGTAATTFFRNYVNSASSGALVFESGTGNYNTNGGLPASFNERMRITATGNVGIGTSSPIRRLQVDGGSITSDTPTLRISSTDGSGTNKFGIEFYSNSGADVRGKLLADNNGRVYLDDNGGGGVVLQANGGTGNVGIGTASPQQKLHIASVSDNSYGLITTATNWASNLYTGIKLGSTGDTYGAGADLRSYSYYSANAKTELALWVNNTSNTMVEVVRATENGLTFNGDTAAANALDDYEEGTFTATLKGSISDPTTAVTTTGYYTKIGRFVTYTISFNNVNTNGASGVLSVIGLPYTSGGTASVGTISSYLGINWGSATSFNTYIPSNSTILYPLGSQTSASWTDALHNPSASVYIWMNGTYFVS